MADNAAVAQDIQTIMGEIASLDIEEELVRTQELGTALDFSEFRENFEDLQQFSREVEGMNLSLLSRSILDEILASARTIQPTLQDIMNYSPSSGADYRSSLMQALMTRHDSFRRLVLPFTGYLAWSSSRQERARLESLISGFQSRSEQTIADLTARAEALSEEASDYRSRAEEALAAIREAAAEAGVSQEAATFHEAAERYSKTATKWLWASVAAALVTIGAAFGLVLAWAADGEITDADVLQLVLVKAAMLAVLTYGTITAVRLYRSSAHLAAVNRHREDALRTFQTFVSSTASDETKDQVLLAAARAAFGQVPTGLVTDKGDGASVLEVLAGSGGNLTRRS